MTTPQQRDAMTAALADRYCLAIPRQPIGGVAGQQLGASVGSSLEFQDHRAYSPGDDPRHIDWAAFARTDQLTVRLYREEVSPRLEVLVDCSASMNTGAKIDLLRSLLMLLVRLADKGRAQPLLWLFGREVRRVAHDLDQAIEGLAPDGRSALGEQLAAGRVVFRPRSIRVLVSDFLFPHDPDALVRRAGERAAALTLVQLLADTEDDPARWGPGRQARLIDVETGQFLDVTMDPPSVRRYLDRLTALKTDLARAARRAAGRFVCLTDAMDLESVCRDVLVPAGVLEVK